MNTINKSTDRMTNYRWIICMMLFFATTINYLDRQVLSLLWGKWIGPEFGWTNIHYGYITTFFSGFYALCMLFAGRFVDWMDTKKGFLWAIGIWSIGACLHAYCGIATAGIITGTWFVGFREAAEILKPLKTTGMILNVSIAMFIFSRAVLALGEAGNFPAAIKATAEYFPKKDRAYATSIFNSGAQIGAALAPLTIPFIAGACGWEMAFMLIGVLGFIWMGFWVFVYKKPESNPRVNKAELNYILSDVEDKAEDKGRKIPFKECFKLKQTWSFAAGKLLTDGVWWFFLFWAPAYMKSVHNMQTDQLETKIALAILYAITMLSLIGGYLPSYFVKKKNMEPYAGRMKAMLIFAFFPLLALLAQPLGNYSFWMPIIIIGIAGAAHQAWSANLFSTVGDMFPKSTHATITGIGGMAGGIGSVGINLGSGALFDYTQLNLTKISGIPLKEKFEELQKMDLGKFVRDKGYADVDAFFHALKGSEETVVNGINTGYMIIFSICAVAYLIGWFIMKTLVPKYKPVE